MAARSVLGNHDDGKVHLLYGDDTDDPLDTATATINGNISRCLFRTCSRRAATSTSPYQPADPRTARDAESVAIALATLEPNSISISSLTGAMGMSIRSN